MKKFLAILLALAMTLGCVGVVFADENDIKIIYTNDVHCAYKNYDKLATLTSDADLLIDGGDSLDGDLIGALSKGEDIITLMNKLGYDLACVGNHDFGYGVDQLVSLSKKANFPYLCCNFKDLKTGEMPFDAYKVFEVKGKKLAFVAALTPTTLQQINPQYFKDDLGNYVYSFYEGNKGENFYNVVQKNVDAAKANADFVILLSHLGSAEDAAPYTIQETLAKINGVDAVLDAHSHSVYADVLIDKDGKEVPAIQTGTGLVNAGEILIKDDGTIAVNNIALEDIKADASITKLIDDFSAKLDTYKNTVIAKTSINLTTKCNGKRAVRNSETNLGDFVADAYRKVLDADIAFVNGGGIRADIDAGDITMEDIIKVFPYNNTACLVEVSGQQIKDALELGCSMMPGEFGGFLQVSGITYTIDATKPSKVVNDDAGNFLKVDGEYRVKDIMIGGKPIELNQTYTLASHNFMLKAGGDGFAMFGANNVKILRDDVMHDNQLLAQYITDDLGGVVPSYYKNAQGRIKYIINVADCQKNYACSMYQFIDLDLTKWYHEGIHDVVSKGLMNGIDANVFNPNGTSTRAQVATVLYRMAGSPDTEITTVFTDFYPNAYYAKAASWCYNNDIVYGVEPHTFGGDLLITREQFATMLYRFAKYMGVSQADLDAADVNTLSYEDIFSVNEWAQPAMHYCIAAGIIQGNAGFIRPLASMTRAEMATMLYRYAK